MICKSKTIFECKLILLFKKRCGTGQSHPQQLGTPETTHAQNDLLRIGWIPRLAAILKIWQRTTSTIKLQFEVLNFCFWGTGVPWPSIRGDGLPAVHNYQRHMPFYRLPGRGMITKVLDAKKPMIEPPVSKLQRQESNPQPAPPRK